MTIDAEDNPGELPVFDSQGGETLIALRDFWVRPAQKAPEIGRRILFVVDSEVCIGNFNGAGFIDAEAHYYCEYNVVAYWMPLPELP